MDKLRAMRCFCRAVEAKSFAAAAQSLSIVPSALSKIVAALEHELGFRLMNRSTRQLSLTDEGALYYEQCRKIFQAIEDAEVGGHGGKARARGTLRVGMHPALRFEIVRSLGTFLDRQPELNVETVITNSPAAVVNEGLDLVLHIGRLSDSSLVARRVGWTRSIVCASPGYLAAAGTPKHPRELSKHRALIYARRDEEPNTRWQFAKGDETCEVEVPVRIVSRDGVGLVEGALGGGGIARPFDVAVRHWLGTGELCELLVAWRPPRQAVTAVMPSQSGSSAAKVRVFLEHVTAVLEPAA